MSFLYIHIPFCKKKCNYCSFVSFCGDTKAFERYFDALCLEFSAKVEDKLKTAYIGGGTPSIVPIEFYQKFNLVFFEDYEFTFEINPKTVDMQYLQALKDLGVNRLSIGVQSFDDEILVQIGRIHSADDAKKCVKMAQEVGFGNISIDLIYGLPNQTMCIWQKTITEAVSLGVQHISTYGLKIEKGTYFAHNIPENLPDEDICADMYLECIKNLSENGFEHYEISNFALPNFESKHNINYWKNNPYIALGVSAHGYQNGVRYENTSDFEAYLKNPLKPCAKVVLTQEDILQEGIFLGLRMVKGIDLKEFEVWYGFDFEQKYAQILEKYEDFLVFQNRRISLTQEGLMLSNVILAEFI
ncbi:MAG: radical SAM family heme chaperone HemW [bacterium]